jgi:uncharacterized repeat protein (TIGR02543 family)
VVSFYSVIFDVNGGKSAPKPVSIAEGYPLGALPAAPSRDGYTFEGWYTASVGGELVTGNTIVISSQHHFYAHWTAKSYDVTFDANKGKVSKKSKYVVSKLAGSKLGKLKTATRKGYKFKGWYTDPVDGKRVTENTIVTALNHDYYAHWTGNKYKVTFDANKGKVSKKSKYTVSKAAGSKLGKLKNPTRSGYSFKGWYTKKSGGKKISKNTEVPAKKVTYYAQWKKK